jgi:UDP-glucuronate decarboxylase
MKNLQKRVLVTGGAGFLGSHLCDRLISDGHDVLCLDDFSSGTKDNIAHLLGNPSFELIRHDVTLPFYVRVDEIYNLACPASPVHYHFNPVQTTKTAVHGAINVLGLAMRIQARVFQASTSEVNGDPQVHPQTEDYWGHVNPIGYRSCCEEGKRCAETLFFDYWRQFDLSIKVGRIFSTFGPRMLPHGGRVVSNFIFQSLRNEDITVYGDGSQTRSFCFVDDLIEAMVRFMASPASVTGPLNLGNHAEFTIRELAETVINLTRSKSKLRFLPLPSDEPKKRQPDLTKTKAALGWEPRTSLKDGLLKTIASYETILKQGKTDIAALA